MCVIPPLLQLRDPDPIMGTNQSFDLIAAYDSSKDRQPAAGVQPAPFRVIEKVCACTSLCKELGINDPMRALEAVRPVQ